MAVKVIAPEFSGDEEFRERFARESQLAGSVDDPHVVSVLQAGEVDGLFYLVMELVEGQTLRDLIEREGALDAEQAVGIVTQVPRSDRTNGSGSV